MGCRVATYCSKACLNSNWNEHKSQCMRERHVMSLTEQWVSDNKQALQRTTNLVLHGYDPLRAICIVKVAVLPDDELRIRGIEVTEDHGMQLPQDALLTAVHLIDGSPRAGRQRDAIFVTTPIADIPIIVVIREANGDEMFFKVKPTAQFHHLLASFCARRNIATTAVSLLYNASLISSDATSISLNIVDGAVIDAIVHTSSSSSSSPSPSSSSSSSSSST